MVSQMAGRMTRSSGRNSTTRGAELDGEEQGRRDCHASPSLPYITSQDSVLVRNRGRLKMALSG